MKSRRRRRSSRPPNRAANPIVPWLHSLAAMGDERWDEAVAFLQRYLEMADAQEGRRQALQNLSTCYLEMERYDEALATLDEVQRLAPDDAVAAYSRGVTCACAGRLGEATAAFELFARRWPALAHEREVQETLRHLSRIQQGAVAPGDYLANHLQEQVSRDLDVGDFGLIERKARRMTTAAPQRPEGHFALGVACLEQGHFREALEAFQAALVLESDYAPTLYNVGHTYLQLGEPKQAVVWLERALRRDSTFLAALHQLGLACEQLGRREEAVTWWRRALTIDPSYEPAQQRLHEVGQGPPPAEPSLSPAGQQLRAMTPIVKARMRRPEVYRNGGVTLTYDGRIGFVLEDMENSSNATVHAGSPFQTARIPDEDLLDLMGIVKLLLLRQIDAGNTRDVAVLTYYADHPIFNYQAQFNRSERTRFESHGRFIVAELPRFFKLRIDSDLGTPYGDPMQGTLIFLSQQPEPGILVSTLGLRSK